MPSLIRFVVVLGILAGIAYGAMAALVFFVEPQTRPMSVTVPADRLDPQRIIVRQPEPEPVDAVEAAGGEDEPADPQ
ncbi:hypothetical protein [Roseitalea porphyridii]|uniref:hypothetical protein n=1 Tax=Roseitalea porphyridii TaxID=1852022 RepID=UPI0026BB7456